MDLLERKYLINKNVSACFCRGRDLDGVLKQYTSMVQPSFNHYILPLMSHADIIVPRGGENEVAIQLIVQHVQTQLQLVSVRSVQKLVGIFRLIYK